MFLLESSTRATVREGSNLWISGKGVGRAVFEDVASILFLLKINESELSAFASELIAFVTAGIGRVLMGMNFNMR